MLGIRILKSKTMIIAHKIQEITFEQEFMYLHFQGNKIKVSLRLASQKLCEANEIERNFYTFSPSGYGIHWPLIDEDLSVEALLKLSEQ
jgi:hypothetical protein